MEKLENVRRKTDAKDRFLYGMPRLGTSIVLGIEGWALLTLYTAGYGLDPFRTGFALAMGYLTIAASQFLLGWLSDAKYTKLGRRKPYILIFAPLLGISTIFLLLPRLALPNLDNKNTLFFWLLGWDVLFRASYACTTPYQAWMAELFTVDERPKVSQVQNTFNYVGNGLMSLFSLLILTRYLDILESDINSAIPIWISLPVIIFGIFTIVLFYIIAIFLPTEPKHEIKSNMGESLISILRNKNFMLIIFMVGISGLGWSMITSTMLLYTEEALNLGDADYLIVAIFLLVFIFIFLYIWRVSIQKNGKKRTLLYLFLIATAYLPITLLGLIPMPSYLIFGIIYIIGIAAVLGGWFLFPYIVYADVAEDDEKTSGELKAGIYAGFPSIILNIFQAFGVFLVGSILSIPVYYSPTASIEAYSIGLVLWGPVASIFLLIAYIYTKKFVTLDFEWEEEYSKS
ncbi:MAG: MFS transporter [Candidatus Lokiarchaeota archaeon]|nr:MFS transporter [Candidatus Lokiarchaeota archaeon]MBD3200175.1 MFS transporter [Candidatus Lokiarchaeota archaeon]